MNNIHVKPGVIFWILGVLFLLWNLIGCGFFLMDAMMSDAAYAETYGAEMAAAREFYPVWAMAAYGIAVGAGLLAAILFLLRKSLSVPLFIVAFIAALICFIPNFTNGTLKAAAGSGFWIMPLIVVIIGVFEIWYARQQRAKGILH